MLHLPVVDYLSTTEIGPPAEPSWRAIALTEGGGAIGIRSPDSVSFPPTTPWGPPPDPGPLESSSVRQMLPEASLV